MKYLLNIQIVLFAISFVVLQSCSATKHSASESETQVAEISCGQCQLGLEGNGCDLAVRIKGKAYYIDGSGIDDHGDAHAADGMCNAIRKAEVQGKVVDNRFQATSIKLLPIK